jgi:hypothetical protein
MEVHNNPRKPTEKKKKNQKTITKKYSVLLARHQQLQGYR